MQVVSKGQRVPVPSWTMFNGALMNLSMMVLLPLLCIPQMTNVTKGAGRLSFSYGVKFVLM
jgi:hypothetical protein